MGIQKGACICKRLFGANDDKHNPFNPQKVGGDSEPL